MSSAEITFAAHFPVSLPKTYVGSVRAGFRRQAIRSLKPGHGNDACV